MTYLEATMSRANLEQILELLLAEENEKAEEMLHEYVVSKARAEYEKVLDEGEEVEVEDEVEESIDQTNDFEDDILADEEEIDADELGEAEDEEEMAMDMEPEMAMDMDSEEEGEDDVEDDVEDKVDELEAELEDLRAEFEKLLADTDEDGDGDHDFEDHEAEEEMMDSVEYDLEEAEEIDEEELEEATNFSSKEKRQPLDGGKVEADSAESPLSKKPKDTKVAGAGAPVKAKDGSEGKKGESAKDHTPTDNLNVEPKKA